MEKTIENVRLKKLLKQQNSEIENDELQNDILEEIVFNSQFLCYIHYKKESLKKNHFENKKIEKKISLIQVMERFIIQLLQIWKN